MIERIAVPVRQAASVLSGGPGAAIILQRAHTAKKDAAPANGPGQWGPAKESMKSRARRYQEQLTGHSADDAYWVGGMRRQAGGVKFDGFKDGALLEAKDWFLHSGAQGLIDQAQRPLGKVRGTGITIRWHVAAKRAADAIRQLLGRAHSRAVRMTTCDRYARTGEPS